MFREPNYLYVTAFAANIIYFVIGTSTGWTSSVLPKLDELDTSPFDDALSSEETSWISALRPLGAIFGSYFYGYMVDKIGRKNTLLICGLSFLVHYLLLTFGKVVGLYYAARFICGLASGGVFAVGPMYMAEIAKDENRGSLGSFMNVFNCFGVLFSYSIGPYVSLWNFNLILAIFPGLYLALFFFLAPESPHYYVSKQKYELAKSALRKVRGHEEEELAKELIAIEIKIRREQEEQGTILDIIKSKGLTKALIISVSLIAFQELSGIAAVLSYAQTIFEQAGSSLEPAICSIIIGAVQFGASFVTPMLADRLGRKTLLLFSAVGMIISEVPLGLCSYLKEHDKDVSSIEFLPLLCLIVYIITYNTAFATMPWTIMGELFPSNVKSIASAITGSVCGIASFLISKYFQSISDSIGMSSSFWIFSAFCVLAVPFCKFYVIETKGKSLQQIQDALNMKQII